MGIQGFAARSTNNIEPGGPAIHNGVEKILQSVSMDNFLTGDIGSPVNLPDFPKDLHPRIWDSPLATLKKAKRGCLPSTRHKQAIVIFGDVARYPKTGRTVGRAVRGLAWLRCTIRILEKIPGENPTSTFGCGLDF
jgi:hypothetical protein